MRDVVFAIPGDLSTPTGGYIYDRRIIAGLGALGWRVAVLDLGAGFPFPDARTRTAALGRLAALPTDSPVVIDGLGFGALPEAAERLAASHRLIALAHHPLAEETGLTPEAAEALRASERRALAGARRVIVTSPFTARLIVAGYGVAASRVSVVRPGSDRVAFAPGGEGPPTMLAVGAVSPRKGYDALLAACARLLDLPWRLVIVGDLERDVAAVARLRGDIARFDLDERVSLAGAMPAARLEAFYASADLFVLASRFEGYGMAFAEAIAHGLPIVGAAAGATPETVPAGAGLLTPPDDVAALSAALRRLLGDPAERRRFAAGARAAATALPNWEEAAALFSRAIEQAL